MSNRTFGLKDGWHLVLCHLSLASNWGPDKCRDALHEEQQSQTVCQSIQTNEVNEDHRCQTDVRANRESKEEAVSNEDPIALHHKDKTRYNTTKHQGQVVDPETVSGCVLKTIEREGYEGYSHPSPGKRKLAVTEKTEHKSANRVGDSIGSDCRRRIDLGESEDNFRIKRHEHGRSIETDAGKEIGDGKQNENGLGEERQIHHLLK